MSFSLVFLFLHHFNALLASIHSLVWFTLAFDLFAGDFDPTAHFLLFGIFPPLRILCWGTYTSPDLFLPSRSGHFRTIIHLWIGRVLL